MFIDLKEVLENTVSDVFGDLVTRRTGQAVRDGIEKKLESVQAGRVTVIDFSEVRCLDISCADEIVAKLLLTHGDKGYFILRGVSDGHLDALEPVLERHRLAVVAQDRGGRTRVVGRIPEPARRAFSVLVEQGAAREQEVAERLDLPPAQARSALAALLERRLVLNGNAGYQPLYIS